MKDVRSYRDPYATETAAEALKAWDDYQLVRAVELSGMGPGYEQCIWVGPKMGMVAKVIYHASGQLPGTRGDES